MKTAIKTMKIFMFFILMSSFANNNINNFIGTYGVCESNPSQIKLTINSNHTFYYQDYSNSVKKIIVKGTWTTKGNKLILKNNETEQKYHNIWTFDKNGQVAKSRKGFAFYRLNKIDS